MITQYKHHNNREYISAQYREHYWFEGEYNNDEPVFQHSVNNTVTDWLWMANSGLWVIRSNEPTPVVGGVYGDIGCGEIEYIQRCNDPWMQVLYCVTATSSDGEYYVMNETYDYNGRWVFKRKDYVDNNYDDKLRYIYYHNGDELENIIPGWKVSDSIGNNLYYAECNIGNIFNCTDTVGSGIDLNTCANRPTPSPTAQCKWIIMIIINQMMVLMVIEIEPKIKQNYSYTDNDYIASESATF